MLKLRQVFKSYSVQTLNEAIYFTQDLKLGHYIKVPPRATFLGKSGYTPHSALFHDQAKYVMRSTRCSNYCRGIRPGRRQRVDVHEHYRHMHSEPEELAHMSA